MVENVINTERSALFNFSASPKPDHVALNWTTASETNNAWFEIQPSINHVDRLIDRKLFSGQQITVDLQNLDLNQGIYWIRLFDTQNLQILNFAR